MQTTSHHNLFVMKKSFTTAIQHTLLLCIMLAGTFAQAQTTFTVINTADSGPGSLRQAILDANANPGADIIAFNVPLGLLTSGRALIAPATALPDVTDAVLIDGVTQTTNVGNTNAVSLGTGGTVGLGADGVSNSGDEAFLPLVNGPEVEISYPSTIWRITSSDVSIRGIAFSGGSASLRLGNGLATSVSNILIEQCVLGTSALTFADPGVGNYFGGVSTFGPGGHATVNGLTVQNTLFGWGAFQNLEVGSGSSNILIQNVESQYASMVSTEGDGLALGNSPANILNTLISNPGAYGIEGLYGTVQHTTITGAGRNNLTGQIHGIQGDSIVASTSLISLSAGAGIRGSNIMRLTRISTFDNGGLGIDYAALGVSANTGSGRINYPVIYDTYTLSGNNLTISGYVGINPAGTVNFAMHRLRSMPLTTPCQPERRNPGR